MEEFINCTMTEEIHDSPVKPSTSKPSTPKPRRSIRSSDKESCSYYNSHNMEDNIPRQPELNLSEKETLLKDDSNNKEQIKKNPDEHIKENEMELSFHLEKANSYNNSSNKSSKHFFIYIIIIAIALFYFFDFDSISNGYKELTQSKLSPNINYPTTIEEIKARFSNQESETWNEISSAINEIRQNPETPQIILLFANETITMDCLATDLAHVSTTVLHLDSPLNLTPEYIGDDPGKFIVKLKEEAKKVMIIRNILNINAEAIKALHNLCDKINPLIKEAIYIFTMRTNNYQSSQQKLEFVEKHFYRKLSKSIDKDILQALVTRVTDGAIVLVQPEPHLKYC